MQESKTTALSHLPVAVLVLAFGMLGSALAADSPVVPGERDSLVRVDSKFVCMPNNKRFQKEQIPAEIDGKTYYGCCKMCVNMLTLDPSVRVAVDPVSGKKVDKATSVIGATADNRVFYFESEENLAIFNTHGKQ